ncbi:hypothetical protein E3E12_02815 [Formicincola oecophyllae]|uniref:Uncharacterized protein n=1 Tax=Formicincola oecophyllae TaxID=2558361 RepID=A0A4Y6UD60_9PROT|nr:hypothetical protein E3E12_02815 [Formicincola oecophyllae]
MLLNIVRLRYADPPTFLDTTQVISGYNLSRSVSGGAYGYPLGAAATYLFGQGSATLSESPTITYQPLTGQQYAENIVRPISPAMVLPLSLGSMPMDMLLRLTAQSIDGMSNVRSPLAGPFGGANVRFFLLLHDLRQLQIGGALTIRISSETTSPPAAPTAKPANPAAGNGHGPSRAWMVLVPTTDSALKKTQAEVRSLLHLSPDAQVAEVIYGPYPEKPGQVAILTRSMLAILTQLAYGIEVPAEAVKSGKTMPTIAQIELGNRPDVIIHSGSSAPADAYAAVEYKGYWYWISDDDFKSKEAFTMVQVLTALAATTRGTGAIVTIPVGG